MGEVCGGEPRSANPGTPPVLYSASDGGHQLDGLGAPDQGAVRESNSAFGPSHEINHNILPLDLFLFLIFVLHLNHPITDQCIGRASS